MQESWPLIPREQRHLRRLRQAVPITMRVLADEAGCSYSHLSRIELTAYQPSPELAQRLANVLSRYHGRRVQLDEFYEPRPRRPRRRAS